MSLLFAATDQSMYKRNIYMIYIYDVIYMYIYMYICSPNVYTHTHSHTHTHTHTHIHTHSDAMFVCVICIHSLIRCNLLQCKRRCARQYVYVCVCVCVCVCMCVYVCVCVCVCVCEYRQSCCEARGGFRAAHTRLPVASSAVVRSAAYVLFLFIFCFIFI